MGDNTNGSNFGTITFSTSDGLTEYTLTGTPSDIEIEEKEGRLEVVEGQLAMYQNEQAKVNEFCFIWHIFDEGVHLKSMTGREYFVDIDSDTWVALYKDGQPAIAKKNIFGFYKKKFWEV